MTTQKMLGNGTQVVRDTWENGGASDQVGLKEGCDRKRAWDASHYHTRDVTFIKKNKSLKGRVHKDHKKQSKHGSLRGLLDSV